MVILVKPVCRNWFGERNQNGRHNSSETGEYIFFRFTSWVTRYDFKKLRTNFNTRSRITQIMLIFRIICSKIVHFLDRSLSSETLLII